MDNKPLLCEMEMEVMGIRCSIQVFEQGKGRCFALTRFSDHDAIISDGKNLKDTLKRHASSLPMAISCRKNRSDPRYKDNSQEQLQKP